MRITKLNLLRHKITKRRKHIFRTYKTPKLVQNYDKFFFNKLIDLDKTSATYQKDVTNLSLALKSSLTKGWLPNEKISSNILKSLTYDYQKLIFEEMVGHGVLFTSVFNIMIKTNRSNDMAYYEMLLEKGLEPNVTTYELMLRGQTKEIGMKLVDDMLKFKIIPTELIYDRLALIFENRNIVNEIMIKLGAVNDEKCFMRVIESSDKNSTCLRDFINDMGDKKESCVIPPMLYRELINFCGSVLEDDDLLEKFFSAVHEAGLADEYVYNAAISNYIRKSKNVQALRKFQEMVKNSVKTNIYTFNTLLLHSGLTDEYITQMFHIMANYNIKPQSSTYNVIIHNFFKQEKPKDAVRYFDLMLERNVLPDVKTCDIMAFSMGRVDFNEALRIFKSIIHRIKPDKRNFYTMLRVCVDNDSIYAAKEIISLMEEKKIEMDIDLIALCLNIFIFDNSNSKLIEYYVLYKNDKLFKQHINDLFLFIKQSCKKKNEKSALFFFEQLSDNVKSNHMVIDDHELDTVKENFKNFKSYNYISEQVSILRNLNASNKKKEKEKDNNL